MIESADLMVLNPNFENISPLDVYESFIWTDRYNKAGDFEIYTTPTEDHIKNLQMDNYIWKSDSDHLMVIESSEFVTDLEDGAHLLIKGRSIESFLDRRIVWDTIILDGKIQGQIQKLINENVISPSDQKRKIPNFIFEWNDDPRLDSITVKAQYTGDSLYDILNELCQEKKVGWELLMRDDQFVFRLYMGEDRSYNQNENPYVVFSPDFDNIIGSRYMENKEAYKTVAMVSGEGEDNNRKKLEVFESDVSGLNRRELFVDARDISSRDETSSDPEATIPQEEYNKLLIQRGKEKLEENKIVKLFDGEADTLQLYRYNEHFRMGDICELENEYSMTFAVRVIEFIYSDSISDGIKAYPTFEVLDEDEESIRKK